MWTKEIFKVNKPIIAIYFRYREILIMMKKVVWRKCSIVQFMIWKRFRMVE